MTQSIFLHTHTHTSFVTRLLNLSSNITIALEILQEQGLCRYFLLGGYAPALRN